MNSPEVFTFLDLEMNQPSNKIIQIGAVVANVKTGTVLDELSAFIALDEPLNPFITTLTGITEEQLLGGLPLLEGYRMLRDMHKRHGSFCNPVTWGGGDSVALESQVRALNPEEQLSFGRRWIDTKTLYQTWRLSQGEKVQAGLAKALNRMGTPFKGTKHNALDDARNTFFIFQKLLKKFRA